MAKIIEDFIVFKAEIALFVQNSRKIPNSSIRGLDIKDTYYNAIKTAIEAKVMFISLDGSINPLKT